tara:strand:- start:2652 stop:3668 length:1017 start_codon:yes stop_codon:yes gene_type:complete
MIKIRLTNPQNMKCFGGLLITNQYGLLSDYSIELTNSNDYDYEFVDMDQFIDKSVSIEDSAKYGIENMSKKTGDYFLFHGGGATDILGGYEVLIESNAKFLFKKSLLSRQDYKEKTVLNKWWFGKGSTCDAGYDIPQDIYDRIKLTGYTVCHNWPHMQRLQPIEDKDIDVCAVYMATHPPGDYNYGVETGQYYTRHRQGGWDQLEKISDKYNIVAQKLPPDVTQNVMKRSKIGISPYGQCEVCYRDLEIIQWGGLLIKPDMGKVLTEPDFYKPMETYVPVRPDWSDLNETIEKILANFKDYEYIIDNSRTKLVEMFSYHNVGRYWYDFFANLNDIESE